ncbi:MAG TPA: pitrilysin family protein [Edaphocola sp.]|nr:pitrilysin family protein [Edaphocola sp.]
MLDRKIAPSIQNAIDFDYKLQKCELTVCPNNIPIYWLQAGAQEVIEVSFIFNAGIIYEPQTAVAQAVAALLRNGTSTHSSFDINKAIELYGATLKVSANNDYAFVSLYCLSKKAEKILPTIFEILTDAIFPEEELQIYQQNSIQKLMVNLLQADFVANRNIDAMLFGKNHPYGRFTEQKDIEALNSEMLKNFQRNHFNADNCKIFVAGNFENSVLESIINIFGKTKWNNTNYKINKNKINFSPDLNHIKTIENDPNGVQASIRMARQIPNRKHEIFSEIFVLNCIFGGYFGSRLMANIREDKGYTYGIFSSIFSYQNAGVFLIGSEVGKDVAEVSLFEVKKEMEIMRNTLVSEEELLLVKNYLLGSLLADLEGPFSILQRWKSLILNNETEENFYKNIDIYKNITAERIQELAQMYLIQEDFHELTVI